MIQKKVTSGIYRYHVQPAKVRYQTIMISCNNMLNHLGFILEDDNIITAKSCTASFSTWFGYWLKSYRVVIPSFLCIWELDLLLISICVFTNWTFYSRVIPCSSCDIKICFIILWDWMRRQYSRLFLLSQSVCHHLPEWIWRLLFINVDYSFVYEMAALINNSYYLCTFLTKISIFYFTAPIQDSSSCQCSCTRWE